MNSKDLKGIFPALMTAFTDDGSDIASNRIRALVKHLISKGVNGFYVGGSSGEMLLCNLDERKRLLEAVMTETQDKVPVIAHVGCTGMRETLELARHAEKVGAVAVSSVTPFYFAYTFEDVLHFYEALAAETSLPVIIYNIPARTGVTFNAEQLDKLLSIPNIGGMKFTSSDFYLLERLVTKHPDKVFYNGADEMLLSGLSAGADGGIGTTYNFQAEKMLKIYRLFCDGNIKEARKAQAEANEMIEAVLKFGVMQACKEIINIGGLAYGQCRPPFTPLSEENKDYLRTVALKNLGKDFMC